MRWRFLAVAALALAVATPAFAGFVCIPGASFHAEPAGGAFGACTQVSNTGGGHSYTSWSCSASANQGLTADFTVPDDESTTGKFSLLVFPGRTFLSTTATDPVQQALAAVAIAVEIAALNEQHAATSRHEMNL